MSDITPPSIVRFQCVNDGKKLRVRIITPGYNNEANCQFPRAIRGDGKIYECPASGVKLAQLKSKFFYRVTAKLVTEVVGSIPITVSAIYESTDCVICLDCPPSIVFAPCGHNACCSECSDQLKATTKKCPMCRSNIEHFVTRDQLQM